MPDATVSTEPVRRELKSAPPDGYVDLLPLPYYDTLERRDGAARLYAEANDDGEAESSNRLFMESMHQWSRQYEFRKCIVGHNLTDKEGRPLDFSKAETLRTLNPAIGMEIETLIDELNGETEEKPDFTQQQSSSSLEKNTLNPDNLTSDELDDNLVERL